MTRFYLRIVVVIFLAIVASIIAFQRLAELWAERFYKPKTIQQLHELAVDLGKQIEGMGEEEAAQTLQKIKDDSGLPIELITNDNMLALIADRPDEPGAKRLFIELGDLPFGVMIQADDRLVRSYMREEERYMARGLIQMLVIIGLAGIFIVRPLVKKLRVQEDTIAKIADGDLSARIDIRSKDAMGRLSQRLNLMADRIQELLGQQRELIQAVSHEMRTPTARIGFALEMLGEAKTEEERQGRIDSLNEDLADMDALLQELLTFLRVEERAKPLEMQSFDVKELAVNALHKVRPFRPELDMEVATRPAGRTSWPLVGSLRYFPRVLENLLMNAMRHAKGRVLVTLSEDAQAFQLVVDDDGEGISEADRAKIFEPFTRLDPSRDRRTGGTGLGLAITKRIIDQHGGRIEVERSPWGGARFRVSLPIRPPDLQSTDT